LPYFIPYFDLIWFILTLNLKSSLFNEKTRLENMPGFDPAIILKIVLDAFIFMRIFRVVLKSEEGV